VSNVKGKVTRAYLLADASKKPLKVTQTANKVSVALPSAAPDKVASVVVMETAQ
jgi:alpha-L-fucosidase